jgi:hypothetical protein
MHRAQLTHAVQAGNRIAMCGLGVGHAGQPWFSDQAPPRRRCPTCAKAVDFLQHGPQ